MISVVSLARVVLMVVAALAMLVPVVVTAPTVFAGAAGMAILPVEVPPVAAPALKALVLSVAVAATVNVVLTSDGLCGRRGLVVMVVVKALVVMETPVILVGTLCAST